MSQHKQRHVFGSPARRHILILASGDKVRHVSISPWMVGLSLGMAGFFAVGYMAATSYLVLRDDLIGGTMARQARMQHEYEDRISALRAQVDRVTSRQLLDQQVVEDKVEKLLQRQMALSSRDGKLSSLLERAGQSGLDGDETVPSDERADAGGSAAAIERLMGMKASKASAPAALAFATQIPPRGQETMADRADRLFSKVTLSLKDVEREQKVRVQSLIADVAQTTDAIEEIVARTGAHFGQMEKTAKAETTNEAEDTSAIGGPFVAPETTEAFDRSLIALDTALDRLEQARGAARKLPLDNPSPASEITSRFGNRLDPFLGRLALHAGIDFRAPIGTRILATAQGTVIGAGNSGSYGNMVEIDHGNGVTTRYAHLSAILVKVGDTVAKSDAIGKSGSTGRSTGPHLHYEVRLNGNAVDPMRFLNAGIKLGAYL